MDYTVFSSAVELCIPSLLSHTPKSLDWDIEELQGIKKVHFIGAGSNRMNAASKHSLVAERGETILWVYIASSLNHAALGDATGFMECQQCDPSALKMYDSTSCESNLKEQST